MPLPARLPKPTKRATRWRSTAHCDNVRDHACSNCGSKVAIEVAHVRMGSGAGMGQKPDDWRTVSLCKVCHDEQHRIGEPTFWSRYQKRTGESVEQLIGCFIKDSPRKHQIEQIMRERANG
jgi:hypothetical protein